MQSRILRFGFCIISLFCISSRAHGYVQDLNEAVDKIVELIYCNDLASIMEDKSPEKVKDLVKNYSPAELAFETEVMGSKIPVIVHFYHDATSSIHGIVAQLAHEFKGLVKVVAIHAQKLFILTRKSDIIYVPTVIGIQERKEIGRLEGVASYYEIRQLMEQLIKGHPQIVVAHTITPSLTKLLIDIQ